MWDVRLSKDRLMIIGGLEDPTGKSDEEFKVVIEQIRHDILGLKGRLNQVAGAE